MHRKLTWSGGSYHSSAYRLFFFSFTQHIGKDQLNLLWAIGSKLGAISDRYHVKHFSGRTIRAGKSILVIEIPLACSICF